MSTIRMSGRGCSRGAPPLPTEATRLGRRSRATSPRRARWYETTSGVALPSSTTTASVSPASAEATSLSVVPGAGVVVLVGPLVLLVDHDQAEVGLRGKYGAAGADDEAVLALPHLPPLVEPLAVRQSAVEHRDLAGKPGGEPLDRLPGERDLGDEHDGPSPERHAPPDGVQVDLRLAAAGDALQQAACAARLSRSSSARPTADEARRWASVSTTGRAAWKYVAGERVAVDGVPSRARATPSRRAR